MSVFIFLSCIKIPSSARRSHRLVMLGNKLKTEPRFKTSLMVTFLPIWSYTKHNLPYGRTGFLCGLLQLPDMFDT